MCQVHVLVGDTLILHLQVCSTCLHFFVGRSFLAKKSWAGLAVKLFGLTPCVRRFVRPYRVFQFYWVPLYSGSQVPLPNEEEVDFDLFGPPA